MDDNEKVLKLNELIVELCDKEFSKNKAKIDNWIQVLNKVYANNYRHTYTSIFLKIQSIISEDNSETLEILGENLNVLEKSIELKLKEDNDDANLKNTSVSFKKFSDHINLEIGRYNFLKNHFTKSSKGQLDDSHCVSVDKEEINSIKEDVNKLSKAVDNTRAITNRAQAVIEGIDPKLESNKISSITTLTIFSAVVLAFSGGITFEAGIFKGMADSSPYRLVFTIALTGFILFNTIFALLYLVGKLSEKNISTKCKYFIKSCDGSELSPCGEGFCNKQFHSESVFCRLYHKYTYVLFVNITLIWVIYIDFFLWLFQKNELSKAHVLLQSIPLLVLVAIFIANIIYALIKQRRMKIKFKLSLIKKIVSPEEDSSLFSGFVKAFRAVFSKKSTVDKFVESIQNCDYKKAKKKLNNLTNEIISTNKENCVFISHKEHRFNIKQWRALKKDFKQYMKKNAEK